MWNKLSSDTKAYIIISLSMIFFITIGTIFFSKIVFLISTYKFFRVIFMISIFMIFGLIALYSLYKISKKVVRVSRLLHTTINKFFLKYRKTEMLIPAQPEAQSTISNTNEVEKTV